MQSSLKDMILFFLAVTDIEQGDQGPIQAITSRTVLPHLDYTQLYSRIPDFTPSAIRGAVSLLQKRGLVVSFQKEGRSQIRLTVVGKEMVLSSFPASLFQKKKWDERWRIIVFSGVRDRSQSKTTSAYRVLRKTLQTAGFVALERGVYVSPFPLEERIKHSLAKSGQLAFLTGLETRQFFLGDEREFVRQMWDLDTLSKDYTKLRTRMMTALRIMRTERTLTHQRKHQFYSVSKELYMILQREPGFPSQWYIQEDISKTCWKAYLQLSQLFSGKEGNTL